MNRVNSAAFRNFLKWLLGEQTEPKMTTVKGLGPPAIVVFDLVLRAVMPQGTKGGEFHLHHAKGHLKEVVVGRRNGEGNQGLTLVEK